MKNENEQTPKDTGHDYDGIRELDNNLPNWWLGTLYGAILFAMGYFGYYVLGEGPTLAKEYEREKAAAEYAAFLKGGAKRGPTEADLQAAAKDASMRKEGRAVFASRCGACHGDQAQGGIGPNLTDDYWIHGGKLVEVARVITDGVSDKGMPPWGPSLKDREILAVVAYIRSVQGSKPASPKAPQGVQVRPESM